MPNHSETRRLPFTAAQMYELVGDVASYPEFLPWTAAARIKSRETRGAEQIVIADLVISFKVFRERFSSKVTMVPEEKRIETEYLDGPFEFLRSTWRFVDLDEGCEVDFFVEFQFKSRLLQGAAGMFFNEAMQRVVRAFEARAEELHGKT